MMRSPVFYFVLGAASVYAYHRFVKPMPSAKA
jgi:hypothetical protein